MIKKITCIECPVGCVLTVDTENCRVVNVSGNKCPKGGKYAVTEIEAPARILTSCVLAEGISLKMVPVRTDKPVPKDRLTKAMDHVKKVRISKDVSVGEVIVRDFLGLGVDLVVTRDTRDWGTEK